MYQFRSGHRGFLLVMVLVFGSIFLAMVVAFMGYVTTLYQVQKIKTEREQALVIAEAGLNYYKWFLAHNPDDVQNGTGSPGPYVIDYENELGEVIGQYSLDVSANEVCDTIMSIDIESTGYTLAAPNQTRTLYARYAKPTVAEYSYIISDSVWAGGDRTIIGPYHSNGFIRMDGTNNSIVTSGQGTWTCDDSTLPCSDSENADGTPIDSGDTIEPIFGAGPNSDLWQSEVAPVDFPGLILDLTTMQDRAENGGGRYFNNSGARGYRVVFNGNTFRVFRVTNTSNDHIITAESELAGSPYSIPVGCPLVYFEDKVWIEGNVSTKVTLAAARVLSSVDPDIIVQDSVTNTNDGALLAVAENNVLIGIDVPDVMEVNGIFMAQKGYFGREYYGSSYGVNRCKDELTINGTIVSLGRVGTKWTGSGCGSGSDTYGSGFQNRINSFDRRLVDDPPPLTPETSDTYRFIQWREVE